ncbi:MAG: methyl CoM reductase subunit C [Methanobacteriaceae archaeon]|nr:methyl CoM reductase subunit C [Methanobacteriaceae archaeon]
MYNILLFSGGVYKFELLAEYIEDVGGLLVQEDRLHISRGSYFLSEEMRVILIVPQSEISSVKSFAYDIKGNIEELKLEKNLESKLKNSLIIYNILSKKENWMGITEILDQIQKDTQGNYYNELESDIKDSEHDLEKCLELMLSLKLIKKRKHNEIDEYHLVQKN